QVNQSVSSFIFIGKLQPTGEQFFWCKAKATLRIDNKKVSFKVGYLISNRISCVFAKGIRIYSTGSKSLIIFFCGQK
ncbi:unnamed protein product, partial [Hymenolepis diminuta]